MKMEKIYFDGEFALECGGSAYIQGSEVFVPEEPTMNQIVTAIKNAGYTHFRLPGMRTLVDIRDYPTR